MAKAAPEDPYCGLADAEQLATADAIDLQLADPDDLYVDALTQKALAAEQAGLALDGISNSGGAGAQASRRMSYLATSNGHISARRGTSFSISCSLIAGGSSTGMERDYEYASTRWIADLPTSEAIGEEAARRTLARLNPRKVGSRRLPVIFDPRVANSLLGHFAGAISAAAVARGTSFLKDRRGEAVFADGISIIDDPHRKRGLKSRLYDGEGLVAQTTRFIDDGRLTGWMSNLATARQLGIESSGHASRGLGGAPGIGASNLYLAPGDIAPETMIGEVEEGLYVTELIGMGVNGVTGDYSRGASGFWIEKGARAFPVSELTIAGRLQDMFAHLTPADDLEFRYGTNSPTVRIDGMTIAGT